MGLILYGGALLFQTYSSSGSNSTKSSNYLFVLTDTLLRERSDLLRDDSQVDVETMPHVGIAGMLSQVDKVALSPPVKANLHEDEKYLAMSRHASYFDCI